MSVTEPSASIKGARQRAWDIGIVFLVASLLVFALVRATPDPDLWGHLRFGLDSLGSRSLAEVDPYSYTTAGQRWINHEWLSEVLLALAWRAGGAAGMIVLKALVGLVTFFLLSFRLYRLGIPPVRLASILLASLFVLLSSFIAVLRPQMYTFLLFAVTLLIVCRAEEGEYGWLWATPAVFAAWANLHGGFLAGLGIVLTWALVHLVQHPRAWRRIVPPTFLAVLGTLANPYGVQLWLFLLRTATVKRPEITEWQPMELVSVIGAIYVLVLCMAAVGWVWTRRPRRPALVVVFLISALLPWTAVRHLPLFTIATAALAGEHIGSAWDRFLPDKSGTRPPPVLLSSLSYVAGIMLLVASTLHLLSDARLRYGADYPVAAVQLLKSTGAPGNLAVHFNWGEYALWHLGPRIKVSVDGRRETVYSEAVYQANLNFTHGVKDWMALLRDYPTDVALVMQESATYNLLSLLEGWGIAYEDEVSALFVREDSALAEPLRSAAQEYVAIEPARAFP
ncbi:MAG: hypothetical protein GX557_08975 [Chloroflexi bacterium]|nr:hypothetical protein [Chloroflexota bacterium]